MMKFTVQCVRGQGARLGKLSEMGRQGSMTLDTPMCMLYTRGGSAPFLGHDLLKRLDGVPAMVHMPVNLLAEYQETIEGYKEGMAKFAALDDKIVYTSSHDPAVEVPSGKNDKASIGVWGKGGKVRLDTDGFIKLQEAIQPDWFQCMSDADTDKMSTKKRAIKAVDRTLIFLEDIMEKRGKSKVLQKSCVFGSLVGGYHARQREKCVQETVAMGVDGFVIEGFHSGGAKTEEFDVEDVADLIKSTMKLLPENCPRVMHGVWRPDRVLEAVEMGVDIFDSSYPYVLTERSHALVFNFQYKPNPEALTEDRQNNEGFTIDLKEKRYADDFSPLLSGCTCFSCTNYTRAYMNHLFNTSELLGSILLMLHNFHQYFGFFSTIREALAEDRFQDLVKCVLSQIEIKP
ncbi:queuine tRNA-ribosyltransferase accessory subunit 2-like [Mya arenaria]|uniref:queuine tRNA-ribosyltransferase accessory subunit 2-like n=1 Tax=Mya arenaria TaxID=6604 RepID=UPI0022DF4107|nr:queuine tRNA-ribosyltransferase accessory subunit 2-like [Mya arenaria]XP_052789943.1 queuine tRNA-ribosyltransferase accessory subunit 2-like [Mya arenaria]XP_052789944.1 queuine tRNA-ribosyltransferase accessory subunit 2-like [Mya arenaria]XP_052789945.1 queuine tRNA-ribosyltransferase accessory subunit 2-like [Mya arenaria]